MDLENVIELWFVVLTHLKGYLLSEHIQVYDFWNFKIDTLVGFEQ